MAVVCSNSRLTIVFKPNAGPKHRGIKPGQRKELLANARNTAQETIEKAKQAVK